jgi:N-acetylgalactosamine-6-sulfatase
MISRRTALLGGLTATAATRRPNIVLILADDLGSADLGCYGSKDLKTPSIDSLARDGVRFTNAYCNAPECTPSRCALLTGRYQQRVGGLECAIGLGNVGRYDEAIWLAGRGELGLPETETTLAKILKGRGYQTALFGKWHLGYLDKFSPNRHGFDEFWGILGGGADYFKATEQDGAMVLRHNGKEAKLEGYLTDEIGKRAAAWIANRDRRKPFFLYVPFNAPHAPFQTRDDAGKSPVQWGGSNRQAYLRMIETMDERIGEILRAIDDARERENTIVLFLSDNGAPASGSNAPYRGSKSSVWEGGIRMPLLIRWPGHLRAGSNCAQVTLMMDVTATLAAVVGGQPAKGRPFDGKNLLAQWKGAAAVPRTVFWRYKRAENRRKAARDGDWKLVSENGKESLYDLRTDPGERTDLLAKEPRIGAALQAKLAAWEREVAAPRLREFR